MERHPTVKIHANNGKVSKSVASDLTGVVFFQPKWKIDDFKKLLSRLLSNIYNRYNILPHYQSNIKKHKTR